MSTLNVDKVDPSTGTDLEIGTSGDTITVPTGAGLTVTDEVKTNKISPATGTAFALGDSGDTFTVPSGATITNSGTATGFGDMTPAFSVYKTSTQSIGNASATLVTFDTEVFDTDSAFASNKFTVPASEGGKYWINSWIRSDGWGAARMLTKIYVNGAQKVFLENDGAGGSYVSSGGSVILDLSATDYVEIYYYHNQGGSQNIGGSSGDWKSFFEGFKLLGV